MLGTHGMPCTHTVATSGGKEEVAVRGSNGASGHGKNMTFSQHAHIAAWQALMAVGFASQAALQNNPTTYMPGLHCAKNCIHSFFSYTPSEKENFLFVPTYTPTFTWPSMCRWWYIGTQTMWTALRQEDLFMELNFRGTNIGGREG